MEERFFRVFSAKLAENTLKNNLSSTVIIASDFEPCWLTNFYYVDLREAFSVFDKNQDGFISKEELSDAMSNFGHMITPSELQEMITLVDKDGKVLKTAYCRRTSPMDELYDYTESILIHRWCPSGISMLCSLWHRCYSTLKTLKMIAPFKIYPYDHH